MYEMRMWVPHDTVYKMQSFVQANRRGTLKTRKRTGMEGDSQKGTGAGPWKRVKLSQPLVG